jgi:hypothetical protein
VEDLIEHRLEALARGLALKEIASQPEQAIETKEQQVSEVQDKEDGEVGDVYS